MKITFFIGSLTGGGAERVTSNLANYLSKKNYDITIISMSDVQDTYMVNTNIKRVYLINKSERKNKVRDFILRYKRLKKYVIDNQDIDCYIVMLPITIFMLSSLKKYMSGKLIISERNAINHYNILIKLIMKYSAKKADGLVVQTEEIGEWFKNKNKIVIPNAINKNIVLNQVKKRKKEKKIVSVGRLEKQKNYPMLIKAFNIFSKKHPDYILEIYGVGNEKKNLKQMVDKYKLQNKIIFKGYVNNISEQIYNSSIFIMTSNFEGMPNSLIEAMCIGLPCISTDCDGGGARELIKNNENGILIPKNDVLKLAQVMEKIVENPDFAEFISNNAKMLNNTLSYEKIYLKWLDYIKDIYDF